MSDWNLPRTGACRCGRIEFEITAAPLLTMACHCTGCQRMASSAFSLSVAVPSSGFAVTKGETVVGGLHGDSEHHFCSYCMSWLFTHPGQGMTGQFVNVRPTMFDDPGPLAVPFVETMTSERLPWATTSAVHSFETFPPMEDYLALTEAFSKA